MSDTRILVPLDGSPESESIVAAVMPIVRERPSRLYVLSVLPAPDLPPRAGPYLAKVCRALRVHDIEVAWDLRVGEAAPVIVKYARECEATLIAMATHGRRGLSRLLLGSVTEEVLRHADVPLVVSRPGTGTRSGGKVVVAALDGTPEAEAILPDAVRLARTMQGELHLLHVAVPYRAVGGFGDFPMRYSSEDPYPYLDSITHQVEGEGVPLVKKARIGGPAGEILRYAGEAGAALVCMTTHGRSGIERLVVGSIAEEVMRDAPCPVLIRRTTGAAVATPTG